MISCSERCLHHRQICCQQHWEPGAGGPQGAGDPGSPPPARGARPQADQHLAPPCGFTRGSQREPPPPVGPGDGVRLLGTGREGTAGRGSRAGSQHLTPAALLYRAAVTRSSQVKYRELPELFPFPSPHCSSHLCCLKPFLTLYITMFPYPKFLISFLLLTSPSSPCRNVASHQRKRKERWTVRWN